MTRSYDVAIVGGGMAGASLAAELAPHRRVLVLEAEDMPGLHATGRSAAFWSETYGGALIQPLTTASGAFLQEHGFLRPRGALHLARSGSENALHDLAADFRRSGVDLRELSRPELEEILPDLRPDWTAGLIEPSCADIDVAGLHQRYLRAARQAGAEIVTSAPLQSAVHDTDTWALKAGDLRYQAGVLVNAAGAWADEVARLSGEAPLGLQPYRRTVAQLRVDPPASPDLPLVIDVDGTFYFKPEAGGRLWLSPHDETPAPASDCAAEELDVAIAIDRLSSVVPWTVSQVERRWAGLRTFAPDRLPVYGFSPSGRSFFWFAGQGGFGIQTAPAAARLAASLLLGHPPHPSVAAIDPAPYSAARFGPN